MNTVKETEDFDPEDPKNAVPVKAQLR